MPWKQRREKGVFCLEELRKGGSSMLKVIMGPVMGRRQERGQNRSGKGETCLFLLGLMPQERGPAEARDGAVLATP